MFIKSFLVDLFGSVLTTFNVNFFFHIALLQKVVDSLNYFISLDIRSSSASKLRRTWTESEPNFGTVVEFHMLIPEKEAALDYLIVDKSK